MVESLITQYDRDTTSREDNDEQYDGVIDDPDINGRSFRVYREEREDGSDLMHIHRAVEAGEVHCLTEGAWMADYLTDRLERGVEYGDFDLPFDPQFDEQTGPWITAFEVDDEEFIARITGDTEIGLFWKPSGRDSAYEEPIFSLNMNVDLSVEKFNNDNELDASDVPELLADKLADGIRQEFRSDDKSVSESLGEYQSKLFPDVDDDGVSGHLLVFANDAIDGVLADADEYGGDITLVKDSGIYLMARNGPGAPDQTIAYARGYDPDANDAVWERSRRAVGGDDFAMAVQREWLEKVNRTGEDFALNFEQPDSPGGSSRMIPVNPYSVSGEQGSRPGMGR